MRDITAERPVQRKSIGLEGADAKARFAIKYILDGPSRPVEMAHPFLAIGRTDLEQRGESRKLAKKQKNIYI